jgi:hypothetical protein
MDANELIKRLQALLRRPVDGVVLRRVQAGHLVGHRLGAGEAVDLSTVFDVVALVPVEPALLVSNPPGGISRALALTARGEGGILASKR